jgi:CHAT domain-containing protein
MKATVQYQFSTALLQKNKADFSTAEVLSFAPYANQAGGNEFPALPSSEQEIAATKGKKLIGDEATKTAFLQLSGKFPVMHLATHAVANNNAEELSFIAFAPTNDKNNYLLYTQEIYGLPLEKTGLVILSACETNEGRLVKGEGILSLSRAFAYAGCPNIITSLWKADDVSTAYITQRIHHYLQQDFGVAKALQQAKIDYLNDKNINPRFKQPYYWSHLVFIGNYQSQSSVHWFWIIAGSVILLFFALFLMKEPGKARHQVS